MIAFEIKRNGSLLTVAGGEDLDSLLLFLDFFGRLGPDTKVEMHPIHEPGGASLSVMGSTKEDENRHWLQTCSLEVNDLVEIAVVESTQASPAEADPTEEELSKMKKLPLQKEILGLEVSVNDDPPVRVGAPDMTQINFHLDAMYLLSPAKTNISLAVIGATRSVSESSWRWMSPKILRVGDTVKARFINSNQFDPPISKL